MSAADEAYKAAVKEIERVRAEGGTSLKLSGEAFRALERLPREVAKLRKVDWIDLNGTQIADAELAHLQGMARLQRLYLNQTQITDAGIAHLQGMTGLQVLFLSQTQITDAGLALLQGMTGLQGLYLSNTQITDTGLVHLQGMARLQLLYLLDTQITDAGLLHLQGMVALQMLYLMQTQITDVGLAHLQKMAGLQWLYLNDTQITDVGLAHLHRMVGLERLSLVQTHITSVAPLAGLERLQELDIRGTQVQDLRPIAETRFGFVIGKKTSPIFHGLRFRNTPAVALDPKLAELAEIKDSSQRTRETLEYLRSLPKYPAPLPWLQQEEIPSGKPAPLQVTERDGKLVALRSATELSDESDRMAAQAWAALRDFLEDLADQRGRIHNMMPNLARALNRFETALSTRFDLCDPIALGIHGERVIGLAPLGAEYLNSADATDVAKFAAAIALFLERFPAWRAYRDDAKPPVYSKQDIADVIPLIHALDEKLRSYPQIDDEIPKQLDGLADAVADAPDEKLAARGMFDSLGNVLSALAIKALNVIKFVGKQSVKMTWAATKSVLDKSTDVALNLAATDYFLNNADNLTKLAAKLPAIFEWVTKFLSSLPFV